MIKFEEHDGKLFKMLDKPVPLKEKDTNVLVQFITHGIIGEYVIEHCLDCNQKNVPIFVDSVDSDGDVTGYIENGNEYICCPFPMFEIIGTPVADGSKEWALYQMMQWECVCHVKAPSIKYHRSTHYVKRVVMENCTDDMSDAVWMEGADPTGWQIYKEPKQQKPKPETLFDTWQCPVCGESISAEFEDSGHPRYNEEHLDENLCFAIGDHMKYSHTVEQPKYKVGDWVEFIDNGGRKLQGEYLSNADGNAILVLYTIYNLKCVVHTTKIIRKLSHSEVVVPINISGTVRQAYNEDGTIDDEQFQLLPNGIWDGTEMFISFDALDTQTRELVESLLKAQEEETK